MARDAAGRRTESTRLIFGVMSLKKFCAIGFWVRGRNRRNLVLDSDVFTFLALQTAISAMDTKKYLKESTTKDGITTPKFLGGVDFPCWVDDVRNALGARIGVSGITLDYIIRAIKAPDDFINDTKRLCFVAAHVGDHLFF